MNLATVKRSELATIKMVAGNEKLYSIVIDAGAKKEWVGFGWIDTGKPTDEERTTYPTVVDV